MLQELFIKDFAIIDSLHLCFKEGLNVLSGETGAGKSIIVGALNLLLGGRASSELIRTSKDEAVVEAVFVIKGCEEVKNLLLSWGLATDEDQLLVRRTISRTNKNKIMMGGRLATMQMLAQLGGRLVDISGQYSQQLLLQTDAHLDILDMYGGLLALRERYQNLFFDYQKKAKELTSLLAQERDKEQRRELLLFQNTELEQAKLSPLEEEELLKERAILANAEKLYDRTFGVYSSIYEDENSLIGGLKKSLQHLEEAQAVDSSLKPLQERLASIVIDLEDSSQVLRDYAEKITVDPHRLESVAERLEEIRRLKRKYGNTVAEILAYQEKIQNELQNLEDATQMIAALQDELQKDVKKLCQIARELSQKRQNAAATLKTRIENELATIGMKKTAFFAQVINTLQSCVEAGSAGHDGLHARGMDQVEFFIAPNPGEEARPLSRIASGGELSRIVLAMKKIFAGNYQVPTLLFDEVDAGIGGAVAEAVGKKLRDIAKTHQVLCITHLPQIACFGDFHYSVGKATRDGRTFTTVSMLDDHEKVNEIARMLGGKHISDKTRAHAQEMLNNAKAG